MEKPLLTLAPPALLERYFLPEALLTALPVEQDNSAEKAIKELEQLASRDTTVPKVQLLTSIHVLQELSEHTRLAREISVSAYHALRVTTALRRLQFRFLRPSDTTQLFPACHRLSLS